MRILTYLIRLGIEWGNNNDPDNPCVIYTYPQREKYQTWYRGTKTNEMVRAYQLAVNEKERVKFFCSTVPAVKLMSVLGHRFKFQDTEVIWGVKKVTFVFLGEPQKKRYNIVLKNDKEGTCAECGKKQLRMFSYKIVSGVESWAWWRNWHIPQIIEEVGMVCSRKCARKALNNHQ